MEESRLGIDGGEQVRDRWRRANEEALILLG